MVGSVLTITCLMNKNAGEGEIRGGAGSCRMSRGTCSRRGIERTVMPRCSKRLSFLIVSIFIHTVLMRIQSLVDLKSESTIRKEQFHSFQRNSFDHLHRLAKARHWRSSKRSEFWGSGFRGRQSRQILSPNLCLHLVYT